MEELESALVEVLNASPIPFEAKRYVVLKFSRDVEDTYQKARREYLSEKKSSVKEDVPDE